MELYLTLEKHLLKIFILYVVENSSILEEESIEKICQTIYNNTLHKYIDSAPKYICFPNTLKASSNRVIADLSMLDNSTMSDWEEMYDRIIDPQYKKNIKTFN